MPQMKTWTIDAIDYEAVSTLGDGGSAVVWKARRRTDGQVVAIKKIAKSKQSAVRNERFEREIEFGQRATHPNVVTILGRAEDEKSYYYVMDHFPATLRDVINDERDPRVLLHYARQLCDGVGYVHGNEIVHRDIKPENVLIDPASQNLVLADFGIAHFKNSSITENGDLLVNRNYLAPEQMKKGNARNIGKAADVFALGLVLNEMFTKQNSRGRKYLRVRDHYPYIADLDPIIGQMMLQDESQRLEIDTVRGLLRMLTQQLADHVEDITSDLNESAAGHITTSEAFDQTRDQAALDVLAAKHIFERASDTELERYNWNFHCEISYSVSDLLFDMCAQAVAYKRSKDKFAYEGAVPWGPGDDRALSSADKLRSQREIEALLARHPLPRGSVWSGMQQQTLHLFRFLKDYHCEELVRDIERAVNDMEANLRNAPLLWIVGSLRTYLETDYLPLLRSLREEIDIESHLAVEWARTLPIDPERVSVGVELFAEPFGQKEVLGALAALKANWDVTVGAVADGSYSVIFASRREYARFREHALKTAEPESAFEGDVLNLLRPQSDNSDFVALTWDRDFDTAVTLGKVVGTRAA